ncbi:hypothetical protein SCLCIDRAFT_1219704 [Scleroderma citrinum Foug A]|uniref:Uncharacterized protein n=1 Tax=Scleroderma citrinum Foug A TaxID=1036808 RepID=A0A0C3DMA0_9AGAM|nr:hypothetical protein SCLCIDRAFT_1219704 [Scleroderma citrinum Foug A]
MKPQARSLVHVIMIRPPHPMIPGDPIWGRYNGGECGDGDSHRFGVWKRDILQVGCHMPSTSPGGQGNEFVIASMPRIHARKVNGEIRLIPPDPSEREAEHTYCAAMYGHGD